MSFCPPSPDTAAGPSLEERLGYTFRDRSLLETALTHSSWANEHEAEPHNERLEFLGDAVLEVNISKGLFERFPAEREGGLTRLRARLVSEGKLAEIARSVGLGDELLLGRGEETQGGRERPALLADALEALLGAVFLDGGHTAASALLERLYQKHWPALDTTRKGKDFKTRLQEWTQATFRALPVYTPQSSQGPEHAKIFHVVLELPDGTTFPASGSSLKRAEQEAARQALERYAAPVDPFGAAML